MKPQFSRVSAPTKNSSRNFKSHSKRKILKKKMWIRASHSRLSKKFETVKDRRDSKLQSKDQAPKSPIISTPPNKKQKKAASVSNPKM